MINYINFTNRIQKMLAHYDESAAAFAEKIGVQRSSISHILSGRNKPSLEFVLKIIKAYPDVSLNWLLFGEGKFPEQPDQKFEVTSTPATKTGLNTSTNEKNDNKTENNKKVERIIFFFKDGSFKTYQNN